MNPRFMLSLYRNISYAIQTGKTQQLSFEDALLKKKMGLQIYFSGAAICSELFFYHILCEFI